MRRKTIVEIVEGSKETRTISANKNGQLVELDVRGITLNFIFSSDRWHKGNMVLLHDPKTGLFGWHISINSLTSSAEGEIEFLLRNIYIYITPEKMVWFKLIGPFGLIRSQDFIQRSPSLELVQKQWILTLENDIIENGSLYREHFAKDWYGLGIYEYLSFWFEHRRNRHYVERVEKINISHVMYEHSQWTITLESSDQKQTFVQLDDHYNIVGMSGHGVFKNAENQNLAKLAQITIDVLKDSKKERSLKAGRNVHHIRPDGEATIREISINYRFNGNNWKIGHLILLHHFDILGWYFASSESFTKIISNNQERIEYFLANSHIFFFKEKLIYFLISHSTNEILYQEFFDKYRAMDDAFRDLLVFLKKQFLEVQPENFLKWYRRIPLEKYLSRQFFQSDDNNVAIDSNIKITRVTHQNAQWKLKLKSTVETEPIVHEHATFILDENYNVIEVLGDAVKGQKTET